MLAALYVRVSTEEQAEHGFSLDAQKERLIAFSKSQGWDDFKLYIDDGYTGTKTDRPALKRMIRHIEEGKIHTVIVYKLDRLSRRQKDVLGLLEDVFEKKSVNFKSATEPFDTSTPFGKAMIGVLAVFAQLDRDMIIERTTVGRRQKTSKGQWYGGRIPFGYHWNTNTKELEIIPEQANIIRQIFTKFIEGHSRLSIAEWASKLTSDRVIDHTTIRDIISRPIYVGKLINAGTLVRGNHEPIIDNKTWELAQQEEIKRKEGNTALGEYLLTGLLQCGVCGGGIVHVKRRTTRYNKEYLYELYACKQQHVRAKDRNNNCTLGYIRREKVENYVIEQIKSFELFPKKITEILERSNESDLSKENEKQLRAQLKKVNTSLENLYDAIENGDIKASSLSSRIRKLEEQREYIENEIDELTSENNVISTDETIAIVTQISGAWDYFTEGEQKSAIRKLVKNITLHPNKEIKITWAF